jgi:hypothetical protein
MSRLYDDRVVLGSLRFKSAPNTDLLFKIPFNQSTKIMTEYDRSVEISLAQVFDDERQNSTLFRPTAKFQILFYNSYIGFSNYLPFNNNLYIDLTQDTIDFCNTNNFNPLYGFPQYFEFDFIRTDFNVTGYTVDDSFYTPSLKHIPFIPQSASTYNWNHFISYGYENDYNKNMQAYMKVDSNPLSIINWIASEGIPFVLKNTMFNGLNAISFICPVKHGLNVGEFIELSFSYNGQNIFQVDSIGDGSVDSKFYIVNIINPGFTGIIFVDNTNGTFKRVLNPDNLTETTSKYYVRKNKILTSINDQVLTNAGFEQNIFGNKKQFIKSNSTNNGLGKVNLKQGSQSYTLSFQKDIDIMGMVDNQMRPVSELFFTTIWKGYFGWTLGEKNNTGGFYRMREGWEFNLPLNPVTQLPINWWSYNNSDSDSNIPNNFYNLPAPYGVGPNGIPYNFVYNETLNIGDVIDGDFCEWNDFEQTERVISDLYHKITFNRDLFNIGTNSINYKNQLGYFYKPHTPVQIRVFSSYLESGLPSQVTNIPSHSQFSQNRNVFVWKDIYTYGFIDTDGIGVDFPFLNNKHHPYKNIIFRIIPEGTNSRQFTTIIDPTIDECE